MKFSQSALAPLFIEKHYRINFTDVKITSNTAQNLDFVVVPVKSLSLPSKVI